MAEGTDTPRVEEALNKIGATGNTSRFAEFARQLERELAAKDAALQSARKDERCAKLESALRNIRGNSCANYTTGLGSCFRAGRTPTSCYSAERCCDPCIAHRALGEEGRAPPQQEDR